MDPSQANLETLRKGLSKSLGDLILVVDKIQLEIEAVSTVEDASQKKIICKGILEAKTVSIGYFANEEFSERLYYFEKSSKILISSRFCSLFPRLASREKMNLPPFLPISIHVW